MRGAAFLSSLVVVLAGCADPEARSDERLGMEGREGRLAEGFGNGSVAGPSGGPPVETTRSYAGTIVLRGASNGGPTYMTTGDPAWFCFELPTNVTLLRGIFSFSPWQQAGYEFRHLGSGHGNGSWNAVEDPASLFPASPIQVEMANPESGPWFTYGGPGIVGGAMDWTLDLTMVTQGEPSAEAVQRFEDIDHC